MTFATRRDRNLAERSIELDSIELAAAIFGNCDQNIHLLEKEFGVTAARSFVSAAPKKTLRLQHMPWMVW